eukprot:TRINITY_DN75768_c0_g1_i1.p1 TRINITY_DN75768_c0_g1~~TRINITY_DN75768_c0_g1_i1.p1  ORF type:complete len:684 (-),score=102.79 TRINITY_DN75768_c0_g1_i1:28-2079(-)
MYGVQQWQPPRIAAPQPWLVHSAHVIPAAVRPVELDRSTKTPRLVSQAQSQFRTVTQLLPQQQRPQQLYNLQPAAEHASVAWAPQPKAQPTPALLGSHVLQQAVDAGLQEQLLNASASSPAEDTDEPVLETEETFADKKADNHVCIDLRAGPGEALHVFEAKTDHVEASVSGAEQRASSPIIMTMATETDVLQDDFKPQTQGQSESQLDKVFMAEELHLQELEKAPVDANDRATDSDRQDMILNEQQNPDELRERAAYPSVQGHSAKEEPEVPRLKHRHQSSPVQLYRDKRTPVEQTQTSLGPRQSSEMLHSQRSMTPSLGVRPAAVVPKGIASDPSAHLQLSPMIAFGQRAFLMPQTPHTVRNAHLGTATPLDRPTVFTPRSVTPLVTERFYSRDSQIGARSYCVPSPTLDHRTAFSPVILKASSRDCSAKGATQNLQGILLPGRSEAENNAFTPRVPMQGLSSQRHGYSSPTPLRLSSPPRRPLRCQSPFRAQQQELVACASPIVASPQASNCTSPGGAYAQIVLPPPAHRSVSNLRQVGASSEASTLLWSPSARNGPSQQALLRQQSVAAATVATAPSQQRHGCQQTRQASPRPVSPDVRRKSPERLMSSQFSASTKKDVLCDSRRRRWSSEAPSAVPCCATLASRDPRIADRKETSFTPAFLRLQEKLSFLTEEGTVSL